MVRRALLVVALIGASFAGGAALHGPVVARARKWLAGRAGGIPTVDLAENRGAAADPADRSEVPAAPLPDLPGAPEDRPAAPPRAAPKAPAGPRRDRPTPAAEPAPKPPEPPRRDPVATRAAAIVEPTGPAPAPKPAPPDPAPATDWAALAERMRGLGVDRYAIEGEPAGRVRFRCTLPAAGVAGVTHQFEAEADDPAAAAEAALRKVALWRATEPTPVPQPPTPGPAGRLPRAGPGG